MKRIKLLVAGILVLAIFPLLGIALTANAQSFRTGNNITVPSNRTVDSTLYATGNNIDVAGTVQGDVICAGQSINISGTVTGDVLCAGQSVHIDGTIEGNIRIAGQNVTVSGSVGRNANIVAQNATTDSGSKIGGDIGIVAQNSNINGSIGRDLAAASGSATVNNTVGRNIHANVNQLTLQSEAQVQGYIDYTSSNNLDRQNGTEVNGRITRHEPPAGQGDISWVGLGWAFTLYVVISMLIVALVLVLLMPRAFQTAANTALASMGKTILIGIAASILVPIIIVALMFTLIGIPLGILLLLAWLVILFLSGPFAAYLLGRLILRDSARNAVLVMLLGAVVLIILYLIPFLNILVLLLALWFGVGMILQALPWSRPRYSLTSTSRNISFQTATKSATTSKQTRKQ
jgi:cytoskeletal protein CcmA (bactofilin family)